MKGPTVMQPVTEGKTVKLSSRERNLKYGILQLNPPKAASARKLTIERESPD
jgi:hypothetical protein